MSDNKGEMPLHVLLGDYNVHVEHNMYMTLLPDNTTTKTSSGGKAYDNALVNKDALKYYACTSNVLQFDKSMFQMAIKDSAYQFGLSDHSPVTFGFTRLPQPLIPSAEESSTINYVSAHGKGETHCAQGGEEQDET
jgi:hypothetical protein